jgi:hypothetical protein
MQALRTLQKPVTGAFTYFGEDNAYATYQAVPALMLQPLLLPPSEEEATETPEPTETPLATATPTPGVTPAVSPTTGVPAVIAPAPTGSAAVSQVLPITVASTGEGAGRGFPASWAIGGLLAIVGSGLLAGGLARRRSAKD